MLGEWSDEGAGVLVVALAALALADGDYQVELVGTGEEVLTSTSVLLRSSETPDQRQWSLLDSVSYGPGLGALGVRVDEETSTVRGHVVVNHR